MSIPVPRGMVNFRDVGGLVAGHARRVRHGVLYRSESPQFLAPEDADLLVDRLDLRTEIDLRRRGEAEREGRGPLADRPVRHLLFPLVPRPDRLVSRTDVPIAHHAEPIAAHYLGYLEVSPEAVAGAVRALAEPGALPALVHCAAGKDRTGVVIAFALSVAGVADGDIAAEYAVGADGVARVVERLRALAGYSTVIDNLPDEAHLTAPEYMQRFLDEVRARFGSPREWLARHGGVRETELEALGEALTESAHEPAAGRLRS
ncbi:MAG TPA: tyrosine-protein phosphatase [Kineosporiaceae bacterium]